jgi:hypothetical protein
VDAGEGLRLRGTGKRTYVDRATGVEYAHVHGSPLLSLGETPNTVSVFFVDGGGKLVFLKRAEIPDASYVRHGEISAYKLAATDVTRGGRM